jgi:hypothetical protein
MQRQLQLSEVRYVSWKSISDGVVYWTDLGILNSKKLNHILFDDSPRDDDKKGPNLFRFPHSQKSKNSKLVNFFVSHSWGDSGHKDHESFKFTALKLLNEDVVKSNTTVASCFGVLSPSKYGIRVSKDEGASFWIDKICFDQENLDNALRLLPVNVSNCKHFLMLAGKTYTKRMWCAWELFVRKYSLDDEKVFRSKLTMKTIGNYSGEDLINDLKNFDFKEAHCYNPNEEEKLRLIIEGYDMFAKESKKQSFDETIQNVAKSLAGNKPEHINIGNNVTHNPQHLEILV